MWITKILETRSDKNCTFVIYKKKYKKLQKTKKISKQSAFYRRSIVTKLNFFP